MQAHYRGRVFGDGPKPYDVIEVPEHRIESLRKRVSDRGGRLHIFGLDKAPAPKPPRVDQPVVTAQQKYKAARKTSQVRARRNCSVICTTSGIEYPNAKAAARGEGVSQSELSKYLRNLPANVKDKAFRYED